MMRECIHRRHILVPSLFPASVVHASFADASLLFKNTTLPTPLSKAIRRQDTKAQANIPIGMALTEGALSPPLQAVARGLFQCAAGYLQAIINTPTTTSDDTPPLTHASYHALLKAYPLPHTEDTPIPLEAFINTASVFRIWTYQCDGGDEPLCRPHCDPGLCTAMLLGSTPGLEVNTIDTIKDNGYGDFRGDDGGSCHNWTSITAGEGDALLINNTQLECCTGGVAKQLPHRVVAPRGHVGERINIVVELRARHAKHIFALGGRST